MKSRGVHISTPSGTDVHAVAKGRIAFADWLRGFGLLIIIDHGAGYMSLYGENSSLYKAVGEWVSQGDVIAAAGNSGVEPIRLVQRQAGRIACRALEDFTIA